MYFNILLLSFSYYFEFFYNGHLTNNTVKMKVDGDPFIRNCHCWFVKELLSEKKNLKQPKAEKKIANSSSVYSNIHYIPNSYEIQLEKEYCAKGLGRFLMQILELMAHR